MNTHRGFTLVELLLVIAIIGIMTAYTVASLTRTSRGAELEEVTNDVVAVLRAARQNAVTVLEHPERPGKYPSYGVQFKTSSDEVLMYADCQVDTGSGQIELVDDIFYFQPSECSGKGEISTTQLAHGARITAIEADSADNPGTAVALEEFYVLYVRPEPTIWFAGKPASGARASLDIGTVRITIEDAAGEETRNIHLNSAGLMYVES